jgi:hypothetical protein
MDSNLTLAHRDNEVDLPLAEKGAAKLALILGAEACLLRFSVACMCSF